MKNFSILGRPDGLGNRIEEIILVNALCSQKNKIVTYVWNNKINNRSYDIMITSSNLKITEKSNNIPINNYLSDLFAYLNHEDIFKSSSTNLNHEEIVQHLSANLKQEEILKSAKQIKPNFNIQFPKEIKPMGIHIRGTDRISNNNHHHFMKDEKEFFDYLSKAIAIVNKKCPKYVYICSDEKKYIRILKKKLNRNISIVNPICDQNVPREYLDFFALTLCKEIYMCSKFSSFAITASLIGNIPVNSFSFDENVKKRYKALFQYKLRIARNENVYHYLCYEHKITKAIFNAKHHTLKTKNHILKKCKNAVKRILQIPLGTF